jgi:excisionase family DNA binding protein
MMQQKTFLKVKETAELLEVSPNTVRGWGADGKIPEYRHPVNNYRLYKRSEIEALLRRMQTKRGRESRL